MVILSYVNSVMRVYVISRDSSLIYLVECRQQCLLFMAWRGVFRVGGGEIFKTKGNGGVFFFFFKYSRIEGVDF